MPLITGKKSSPRYASMNISRALTHIFAGADFEAGDSNGASAPYNQGVRYCGIAAADVAPLLGDRPRGCLVGFQHRPLWDPARRDSDCVRWTWRFIEHLRKAGAPEI